MDFQKNIAQSFYDETMIEPGFFILKFNNETDVTQSFKREVSSNFIQFHFCIKGSAEDHVGDYKEAGNFLLLTEAHNFLH